MLLVMAVSHVHLNPHLFAVPEQYDSSSDNCPAVRLCLKTCSYVRQSVVSPRYGDRSYVEIRLFRQSLVRQRHFVTQNCLYACWSTGFSRLLCDRQKSG